MKFLYILIAVLTFGINDIATVNALKQEAQKAYDNGDYETALTKYQLLIDSMNVDSDEIKLNLAHSQYQLGDTANARSNYMELSQSEVNRIKSTALNQIGVLSDTPETEKAALNSFKEALKADPTNKEARYNYEVLKKRLKEKEEQKKQDQQNEDQKDEDKKDQDKEEEKDKEQEQNSDKNEKGEDQKDKKEGDQKEEDKKGEDQENKDQQGEDKKDGKEEQKKEGEEKKENGEKKEGEQKEGEEKEGEEGKESKEENKKNAPKSAEQKLKEMNISPQQAKVILEAMKRKEIQHIQQIRRRPTKKRDTGKPDW